MVRTAVAISPTEGVGVKKGHGKGTKGRLMSMCWDCERSECICEKASEESLSLCSEDEISYNNRPQADEQNLSFVDSNASGDIKRSSSTPNEAVGGTPSLNGELALKNVYVSDFTHISSSMPDVTVYGVRTRQPAIIGVEQSIEVETDVCIYGLPYLSAINALFNFCPLVETSPLMTHTARRIKIFGGSIYVGHTGAKKLKIELSNPDNKEEIFVPRGTPVGVLEIYNYKY